MLDRGARETQAVGEGLAGVASAVSEIERDRAVTKANELEFRAQKEFQDFQQNVLNTRRGEKAAGISREAEAFWEEFQKREAPNVDGFTAQLASPALRRAQLRAVGWAADYERTELRQAADTAFKASKEVLFSNETTDPAQIADIADQVRRKNADYANIYGLGPEWLAAQNQADVSTVHTAAVQRMLAGPNPQQAVDYYTRNADAINDPEGRLKRAIDETVAVSTAMSIGADLASRYGVTQTAAAIKELDRRTDLTTRQKELARQELEHRHSVIAAGIDRGQEDAYGRAQLEYERTGTVSASTFASLKPEYQAAILRQQKADIERREGKTPQYDYELFASLLAQAATPEGLANVDLNELRGRLSNEQLQTLARLKGTPSSEADKELITVTQRLNARLNQLYPGNSNKDKRKRGEMAEQFFRGVDEMRQQMKRPPTGTELDALLVDLSTRADEGVIFSGDTLAEALATPDGLKDYLDDIPSSQRRQVEDQLRAEGKLVTDRNVAMAYARMKQRGLLEQQ